MSSQTIVEEFSSDRKTFIRDHIVMAIIGSVLMFAILYATGNPAPWVGIVGSVVAISIRGFYTLSEQQEFRWQLGNQSLIFPNERAVPIADITTVRSMFSSVQIITGTGEKFLIKFQADPQDTVQKIQAMRDKTQKATP